MIHRMTAPNVSESTTTSLPFWAACGTHVTAASHSFNCPTSDNGVRRMFRGREYRAELLPSPCFLEVSW